MIRIATLCQPYPASSLFHPTTLPSLEPLDILCCRVGHWETEQAQGYLQSLAAFLQMTCSSTMLADQGGKTGSQSATAFAILTGSNVWMLNSGSIAMDTGPHGRQRLQFALVRKGAVSVLVIHMPHIGRRRGHLALLQAVFGHWLIREYRYSAVLVCGLRPVRLSRPEAARLLAGTGLMVHSTLQHETAGAGAMLLCVARESGLAKVEFGTQSSGILPCFAGNASSAAPVLICALQVQAPQNTARKKSHYPLSFAEHWAGYKEHSRHAVL